MSSAAWATVIIFAMFFGSCLVGLRMLIGAFKNQPQAEVHNPQLESAETIPMRVGGRQ